MSVALVDDRLEFGLRLEPQHAAVARELAAFDPALRLRRSAEPERRRQGFGHILERKTRYSKPVDSEKDADVRIASRDGFLIVSPVHVSYLMRPGAIVEKLRGKNGEEDMATQTAEQRFQRLVTEQADGKAKRRASRRDEWRGFFAESFDVLDRLGDTTGHFEKARINNAGTGAESPLVITDRRRVRLDDLGASSAGVTPAGEISDEHTSRQESHQ